MLAKILSILAAAALAVKAWAKGRIWAVEKERRASDRRAAAEAEVARLKTALGDALAAAGDPDPGKAQAAVADAAALRLRLQAARARLAALPG